MTGGVLKRRRPNRRTRQRALRRLADRQRAAAHYDPENPGLMPEGVWLLLTIERGPPGTTDPRRPHRVTSLLPLYLRRLSYLPAHQEVSTPVASVSSHPDSKSPKLDPPFTRTYSTEPHHLPRALVEPPLLALPTLQELSGREAPTDRSIGHSTIPSVIQPTISSAAREDSSSDIEISPNRTPLHELPTNWFVVTPEKFSDLPPTPGKWYRPRGGSDTPGNHVLTPTGFPCTRSLRTSSRNTNVLRRRPFGYPSGRFPGIFLTLPLEISITEQFPSHRFQTSSSVLINHPTYLFPFFQQTNPESNKLAAQTWGLRNFS